MQFTTVRSKEKDYDFYLKSEKLVHRQQEHEKMFPNYLEVEKTGSQLVYNCQEPEKDYDIYLKSVKMVHSQQVHEKNLSHLFGCGKNWFLAISSLINTVAAIWREKNVDPFYLETKKCSSQLSGARKKIMTSI